MTKASPAIKSYFFGKGYEDLYNTIATAWMLNWQSIKEFSSKVEHAWQGGLWSKLLSVLWSAAVIAVMVFGTFSTLLLSSLHVTLLLALFAVIYVLFSAVALIDWIAILIRKLIAVCPRCHERMVPIYLCGSCGAEHPDLHPSSYGILFHRCQCGTALPSSLLTNRGRLRSKCPHCKNMLSRAHTETPKQFLAIVGGPSVGKTAYMFALSRSLRESVAPKFGMRAEMIEKNQESTYRRVIADMDRGQQPDKTVETLPRAFDIVFKREKGDDIALYLYDPAGEAYLETKLLASLKFLDYSSGVILLVDPFAFPVVQQKYADELARESASLRPSEASVYEIVNRLINTLESDFGKSSSEMIDFPLAVVINKVDAFDLESQLGEVALNSESHNPNESETEIRNQIIRRRLEGWGQIELIELLEKRFTHVSYFTVSALGHSPDNAHTPFHSKRVEDPVLWILGQKDPIWNMKKNVGSNSVGKL